MLMRSIQSDPGLHGRKRLFSYGPNIDVDNRSKLCQNLNLSFIKSFGKEKRFTSIHQIGMNFQITSKWNCSTVFHSHNKQLREVLCLDSGIHGPKNWSKAKKRYDGPTRTTRSGDLTVRESLALIINFLETFLCSTTGSWSGAIGLGTCPWFSSTITGSFGWSMSIEPAILSSW